jgi:fructokinase
MKKNNQVLCFGEVLWDNLPSGPLPGGAPMNVALHLSRFDINSAIASSVGNDPKGVSLNKFLAESGLGTDLIQIHESLPTSEVLVHLDENNTATYEICKPVAWDEIQLTDTLDKEVRASKAIVFGSLASRSAITRSTLMELLNDEILKIMDVNLRPPFDTEEIVKSLLSKSDIVKLNHEELITITGWHNLTGTPDERMSSFYKLLNLQTLIVTKGEKGASVIHKNQRYDHDGFKVITADSVGAGDAFLAGFLAALFDNKEIPQALKEACAIGAFVASKPGATPMYTKDISENINFS